MVLVDDVVVEVEDRVEEVGELVVEVEDLVDDMAEDVVDVELRVEEVDEDVEVEDLVEDGEDVLDELVEVDNRVEDVEEGVTLEDDELVVELVRELLLVVLDEDDKGTLVVLERLVLVGEVLEVLEVGESEYSSSLLPAPQYSVASPPQTMLQSARGAAVLLMSGLLPQ